MSIGDTTTRLASSSPRSLTGWNIGGRTSPGPWPCCFTDSANHSSARRTNSGSRTRRLSYVTRRLRVMMLNANCIGSWWTYCPRFSNHSRLACAARWVDTTTGLRSAS